MSDLSSWESSKDSELEPSPKKPNLGTFQCGVKKSAGIMDLSKFLTPSDEDDNLQGFGSPAKHANPVNSAKLSHKHEQVPNDRIYDSVENLVSKEQETQVICAFI